MDIELITCPVCKQKLIKQGFKNHIIGKSKQEVWKRLKVKPHYVYYREHCKVVRKKRFII